MDLSRLDYSRTRALVEFELEMDRGFRTVRFDRHACFLRQLHAHRSVASIRNPDDFPLIASVNV